MKNNIQGTGVALVTPFDAKKEVDFEALARLVDHVTEGGADYLVVLGTTAETPTLTREERRAVVGFIREKNGGRLPLILGVGGNNTAEVVRCMEDYDFDGITAILSVTPYYNKPSQEGLYQHYRVIARESPKPVVLYNVPGRTGVNMTAQTTLRLAHDFEKIAAIKEASGSLLQVGYILRDKPENFMVISGDDNMALPMVALGGDGVISVAANAFPEVFCRMVKLCLAGDFAGASLLQMSLLEPVDALFAEGNPVGVKCALALQGVMRDELRLPLVSASAALRERIAGLMSKYNL